MNARLALLAVCQGLFFTNNIVFIAINRVLIVFIAVNRVLIVGVMDRSVQRRSVICIVLIDCSDLHLHMYNIVS